MVDRTFSSLLLTGGCVTDQVNKVVEVKVDTVLEARESFTQYETQLTDSHTRTGMWPQQYEFAASFNFQGDLLDFTMDGGVTITPRRQRIKENGVQGEYSIVLNRKPLNDVTVRADVVMLANPSGVCIQQLRIPNDTNHQVTFTRSNWNREQIVKVTAVDDAYAEGIHYAVITHSSSSLDPNFNGSQTPFLYGRNLTMQVDDNDFAGIKLSRTHMYVGEGGMSDSYDIVLSSMPWYPVTVSIVAMHPNQTRVKTPLLTFIPETWNISQTIVVSAVDDLVSEVEFGGLHYGGKLVHYSESRDFRYNTRRPRCFDVPNCDPAAVTSCLKPDLFGAQLLVRVCDLTTKCSFTLSNGACVANVLPSLLSAQGGIPARFGSRPLDPSLNLLGSETAISYTALQSLLSRELLDFKTSSPRNITKGQLSYVPPPPELRGFVLSFLGLLNLDQAQRLGQNPIRILHAVCAGISRLETHRWAFEEWPTGYVNQVIQVILTMFPDIIDERRVWNCGAAVFRPGNSLNVTIWDNDPGVTLTSASLSVVEADAADNSDEAVASYSIVLNAPPSADGGSLQPAMSMCSFPGSDNCGFWDDFSSLAAQIYSQPSVPANVSIAIVCNSQISVSPSIVTFTTENWFIPQWISVRAVNDDIAEAEAAFRITHRVQNSAFGYTNTTAFWLQGTLPPPPWRQFPATSSTSGGNEPQMPYNTIPTVLNAPGHQHVNIRVQDDDSAGVEIVVNQPDNELTTKESSDTIDWVGDYATAFAFSDISLSSKSATGATGSALASILVLGANTTSFLKFHLPSTHEGDSRLAFSFATLRFHQTPFKIFNVSDTSEDSTLSSSDAGLFMKTYQLRITLVQNSWTQTSVGTHATGAADIPDDLGFVATKSIDVTAMVERSRPIDLNVTALVAQLLPIRAAVLSLKIEVLSDVANATQSVTQMCSSLFERKLRPTLQLGYQFPNLLLRSNNVSQSSTMALAIGPATLAIDGDRNVNRTALTNTELEPWWETCLDVIRKVGQIALFLPESMNSVKASDGSEVAVNIVGIVSLRQMSSATRTLNDAIAFGCPESCPLVRRTTVRKGIILWDIQAGMRCLRIYREGTGRLEIVEVEAYNSFVLVTPTADGAGLRSRLKSDWNAQKASESWRIQQSAKRSEDENLAIGMATRQSSTSQENALSYLAVDGQRSATWDSAIIQNVSAALSSQGSLLAPGSTRTLMESNPWWEVDLGTVKPISTVVLYPFIGMPGRGFCSSTSSSTSNGYPEWSGDLYSYSRTDSLLMLQDPFCQDFEVLITDSSLATASDPASVVVTRKTTLSFSCENGTTSVTWPDAFTKGRFITVRKQGLGILMLNEVEVNRWNPSTTPRYLLLDLYGFGAKPMALSNLQLFPPTDSLISPGSSEGFALPITYEIHSVSSQLAPSGSGSAASLKSVVSSDCYVAAKSSFHEWIVLDLLKPTRVGLIEMDTSVAKCGADVVQANSISIATYGAALDGIRSSQATTALTAPSGSCEIDAMGVLKGSSSLSSCKAFLCGDSACNSHVRAVGTASTLVLSDFSDVVLLGVVDFLPITRLPLSTNEHRAMLLRDNPVALWAFDDRTKIPILSTGVDVTTKRATGALEFISTETFKQLLVDDTKENTFYSNDVLLQASMAAFSLEFWVFLTQSPLTLLTTNSDSVVNIVTINSANILFAAIGVSKAYPGGFFKVVDSVSGKNCLVTLDGDIFSSSAIQMWSHVVASYDPSTATIALTLSYNLPDGSSEMSQRSAKTTCTLAMFNVQHKTINFGSYKPITSATKLPGFIGKLSNVAWYLRALGHFEILDHYHDFISGTTDLKTFAHNSYALRLNSKPLAPVAISINAEAQCYRFNLCNVSVVPSDIVITPENWQELTQIHVLATNDQLYEGQHTTQMEFQAVSKPSYQLVSTASTLDLLAMSNSSNATTVLSYYENQVYKFYRDLQLRRVLIDPQILRLREDALVGLQANWSSVYIDSSVIINEPYNKLLSINPLTVDLIDASVPGIEFSTTSLLVSENGKGNDYQVLLLSEPTSPVVISISVEANCYRDCSIMTPICPSQAALKTGSPTLLCGDESTPAKLCNITISPSVLYFSGVNWSLPQTVRVVAVDDELDEADLHLTSIQATSRSLDPVYDNLFLPDIVVAVEDNDITDVLYSTKYVTLSEDKSTLNYSTTNFYMLSLATEPWANVTIAMSNEANRSCYRPCGYHFDEPNCGLPRQQSVTSVRLSTNSTREIHRIALSIPKVIEVQRIVTYAEHVDQIFRVQVTGGFVEEVQVATFQLSDSFKLRFKSADAMTSAVTYGRTFRIGYSDRMTSSSAIDGFASAAQVESALNVLFKVTSGFRVTRTLLYDQSTLSWAITFARLVSEDATFPSLSVTADTLFEGTLSIVQKSAAVAPTGIIQVRYGAVDSQPLQVSVLSGAADLQASLGDLKGIYTVAVTRTIHMSAYGFEYTVTFKSVDTFYQLRADNTSLVSAPKASTNISVVLTEIQSPERIDGAFTIAYLSSFNSTNNVTRTNALLWNASETLVQSEISSINGIGNVTVSRRRLSAEGGMEWIVEFAQNNGQMTPLTVQSLNLTGRSVALAIDTVRDGESLGGTYVVEMGGRFKKTSPSTQWVYWMDIPLQNTTALAYNTTAIQLQQALLNLNITELTNVTREDLDCDAFAVCNGYTWTISYTHSPGDIPPIQVYGTNTLTGAGSTISAATATNGTYIGGQFSLKLELYDLDTKFWYSGKTWNLPVNVSAVGMDEALEAIPFVRSNREAEFDPETRLWRGIKFDKGVRVYREGPYLDGGYTWRLEWAIEDYIRFQDLKITINVSLVTQEVEPLAVPTQFDLLGYPRCSAIPTSRFQPDTSDPFGLRGSCVYDITNVTIQERFLCNYTIENPWIVFTPENWCVPQKVRLSAVDDFIDEATVQNGNVTFSNVAHTVFSDDLIYVKLPLSPVVVEVESDDFAEVLVSETSLQVREDGLLDAQYNLQLKTEPLYSVKIIVLPWLDGDNTGCYRFGFCNLTIPVFEFTFTPQDWDIPQTVVVQATDDDLDEYDIHTTGISHISYSDDLKYHKIVIPRINVTVVDNDVSALKMLKTSVSVTEGGNSDTYDVILGSEPFAKVTVVIANVGVVGNFVNTTPSTLLFTWKNWNVSQSVRVDALEDFTQDEVNSSSTLVHTITSNDLIYAKLKDLTRVTVRITDNDISGIALATYLMNVSESNTTVYTYGVRLNTEPWQPVIVVSNANHGCYVRTLSSETLCNATVLTANLYFGPGNWSSWQNVSFLAVDDWLMEKPVHDALITHSTVSKDPFYQVANYTGRNGTLQLRITDNDLAFVNISLQASGGNTNRSQLHVAEGGFNDSYRIVLNSEPYEDVQLILQPTIESIVDQNDKTAFLQAQVGVAIGASSSAISVLSNVSRSIQIVFTALDWNQPRVITVFAIDDKIAEGPTHFSSIGHEITSVDVKYNISNSSLGVTSVKVMVNDKEAISPPIPVSAVFDTSGTKLQVTFDSIVYHAETMAVRTDLSASDTLSSLYSIKLKQFACSLVFDFGSAKYSLGKGAICYWLDLKNLRMKLGSGATITVKDTLLLNECAVFANQYCQSLNVIRARSTSRSYTQASVNVHAPRDIVKPRPVLMVPEDAGSCGTWAVDGTLSQGAGGRPFAQMFWFMLPKTFFLTSSLGDTDLSLARAKLMYQSLSQLCVKYAVDWKTGKSSSVFVAKADLSANPDLAFITTMAQLRSACYLRSLAQAATDTLSFKMQIDSSVLEPGVGYSVGLELTNAFAQRTVLLKDVQVCSLPGPSLFVVGERSLEVTRVGGPIVLQVDATVSCTEVIGTVVGYVWTASSVLIDGTSSLYTTVDLSKVNVAKDPRVFKIPRSALEAERSYRFQVEGYMVNNSRSSNSTAVITVNVTSGVLTATITGGSRAIGERDTLVLNGTSSSDPDLASTPFSYQWTCSDVTNTSLVEPQVCINASSSLVDRLVSLDLTFPKGALLTLAPFSLQQNRTLTFTLTVAKTSAAGKTRISNTSTTVWTTAGSVPDVTVAASSAKIIPSTRVALTAQVKSTYPYTSRWVQTQGDLVLPSDGINTSNDAFALPLTSLNNMIVKNKLTPGLTYIFRLIAIDVNGNQGFGSVTIRVNSPPSSGRFDVSPKSGYGAQDLFTLTCAEWTDDLEDLPLKYSFGVIGTADFNALMANASNDSGALGALLKTRTVPIVSEQLIPTASVTMLPPSSLKPSENVTIVAFISDSLGGFAVDSEDIVVLLPAAAKSNPMGFVNGLLGLDGGANGSDASQRLNVLLSAASILQGAYSSGLNDTDGCLSVDLNGKICSDHGACDPETLKCVCVDAYMGANCDFEVSAVRTLNTAILSSLSDSAQVAEPSASALSQQALIMDTVIQSSSAAFNQDGLAQVALLSTDIVENAFSLQDQGAFLDSAGKTVLDSLSTVVAISSGTTTAPAAAASIYSLKGGRRLATMPLASTGTIDCSLDTPESNQTKTTFFNTIGTLLSLTAIASQDALLDEDAICISSSQIQALTSAGTSFKASTGTEPGLAVQLTEPAIACLEAELFLSAFVLVKPPHSLCSLKNAKQLSASTVFAVHSKSALTTALSGGNNSIAVQKLSSSSLCVIQAAAKATSAGIVSGAKRRLAEDTSALNDSLTATYNGAIIGPELAWHPLIVLTIPHLRPLTAIEQSNFTTACYVWSSQISAWDADICFKDDATSSALVTVCYCSEIAKLEVLVTLEERLDYYALYKNLYRNESSSVVPAVAATMLFWLFLLGSRVGQRMDTTDETKAKEKTIKSLNRVKWGELQERTASSAAVLEDFTAFYARKKLETQPQMAENNSNRLAEQIGVVTDATTAASRVTLGGDGENETVVLADVVTAATAIDPSVTLPNEARTLFGASKTLETQYAFALGCLQFCNAVVIVLGVILGFVGLDFHLVLGNSTSELLLYVYGKSLGLILLVFGGVLVALGVFGLAVARAKASHTSRNTYLTLFSLVLIAQLALVIIAFKYLDDFESMPSALLSTLSQVWNALHADVKQEVEAFYGCCGFLSIKEASACPEEALDAVPPRTCSHALTTQAREFFGHSFGYLQVLFLVEAICILLANVLVKWRHLRLQQLAGEPASSANGETSAKRAMLSSPLNVVLLCTLPSLYYLLSCMVVFAVFYGVDLVVQLNFVSNAVVSALYGVEIGGLVIATASVYLVILLRGIHALAYRDIRGLQWVVGLSLAFLIVSFGVSQFFWGIESNLLIDPVLIEKTESRYLSLPRDILVKLELAMECCGFDKNTEGTCATSSSTSDSSTDGNQQHLQIRTCRASVEQILLSAITVFNTRVTAIVVAEAVVFALSVVLLIRLRRFAGKPEIHPTTGLAVAIPEIDEYQTTFDIFVHNACMFTLVLLNVLASVLGLVVLWAGIDAIYQLNVLHISYLLQTFDRRIGVHLIALGGGLEFFACVSFVVAWKRSRKVFLMYMVTGLALFAAAFGALGVSYRFAHTAFDSDAMNFRLEELWRSSAPTTKGFVQNAFTCCGYERSVASNGTIVFSVMAQATFWTQTSETSSAPAYARSEASDTMATVSTTTHRALTETKTHTFTQAVCPSDADIGCSTVMKQYLTHVARYTFKSCIALLSFLVVVLVSASILILRQGKKTPWKQSWRMVYARMGLLSLSFGSIFASLMTLFIAVDLVARWSIFSSSLLQLLFAFSIGIALLVYAAVGVGVNVYTLYAAVDNVVHHIFFQCLGRGLFALSLWLGVGLTGYLSHYSADSHWQNQLSEYLNRQWNTLSSYTQHLISLDYQCCGFNDPVVVKGKGIVFDRPAIGYTCPLSSARGCQHVLVAQISSSFGWLFVYLLSLAVVESLLMLLGIALLKQLKRVKVEEWFAIESRVRYAAGKYKSDARKHHLALSLCHSYDPKFTRAQRLTSILCAVLTSLAIFTGYFATKGCHRKSLKTCEQPDVWGILSMGLLYGGLCGYTAQCTSRFVFELIRHRCDDESSEVAGARQRKEKVLLFRSLFQRRRPRQSVPMSSDIPGDKVGVSSSTLAATSLAPSTMDTSHATTEERWFTWLLRFVYRIYHAVAAGLFLVSCGIGTLMGLVVIGYSNTLYGVKIDQGPKELLVLSLLIALVSLLAWLAVDMKDRKRSGSHVVFIAVAIASLLLMASALLGVYMVYEVIDDTSTSATDALIENWSVRKTGFSVVTRLEEAWKAETSTYFRNRVQQDLQCCGFRSAEDFAFRPCPTGTSVQVEYEARSVNGSALVKAQSEVRDLDGCLTKMLELFHGIADTVAYFAIGICLAQFLLIVSAVFLAYDVVISKDSKLKLRVSDERQKTQTTDVRQTFEKVVGLKIAAPARGKILSKMLSSSLDSVAPTIASELAAASLVASPQSHYGDHHQRRPSVSSASKLASPNAPVGTVLPPQRWKSISQVRTSLDDGSSSGHSHEEIASVPYPASIVYVVFTLFGAWIALMLYLVFQSSMALGKTTAWYCVLCWGVGLVFHLLLIEPGVIFTQILWSTLGAWWRTAWLVRVIRYGREALRIKPDAATAAARYYASLSLYERIRFNAAVRVQRQLLTRVTRGRYLQLVREKRQESHRSLAEQRRLTVKKAIEGFTEDEVRAFALIFQNADAANLGLVSHTVISQSIYQLGVRVAPELVFKFLEKLDPAYADLVDFEHFLYGMHCVRMHHQEEQNAAQAASQAEAVDKRRSLVASTGNKEEFVSSSARFGPGADPQSRIFVKRQNLLRELKEKRESLSYKLMSKVGKLPPLLQRGRLGAKPEASASGNRASLKDELSLDDVSEQSLTRSDGSLTSENTADEALPTGAFVILQNRKLSPKKRALEMVLKKKHRDDRGKAGGAGRDGGEGGSKSPSKAASSPTQRAKAMVQNWKMPSPRGWSNTNPSVKDGHAVEEPSISTVVEEDNETVYGRESAEPGRIETRKSPSGNAEHQISVEAGETPSVEAPERTADIVGDEETKEREADTTAPSDSAAEAVPILADKAPSDTAAASDSKSIVSVQLVQDTADVIHDAVELSVERDRAILVDSTGGDEMKGAVQPHELHQKQEVRQSVENDGDEGEEEAKQEEPKPFGTYMLLNKQAPSAGKSKIMENILQKKKLSETIKTSVSDDVTQQDEEEEEKEASREVSKATRELREVTNDSKQPSGGGEEIGRAAAESVSEAKDLRPKTSEKKAAGAAKSSLEKALKKKSLTKGSGKESGLRKPATSKGL